MVAPIVIGVSGWSYPDWENLVYPRGCRDKLRFLAEQLDCLEINTTFYRMPDAARSRSWAERIKDLPTFFTAKVPQDFTHLRRGDSALLHRALLGFEPLAVSGKLRALLLQFTHSFDDLADNRRYLQSLVDGFGKLAPICVELRHPSFRASDAQAFLASLGASLVALDYPGNGTGFGDDVRGLGGPAGIGYLRLHGRNATAWYAKNAGRDAVYDWEYSESELAEVEQRLLELAKDRQLVMALANNHFHGKAMKVALQLIAWLRKRRVSIPGAMLVRFPDLAKIAAGGQRGLFG